MVTQLAIADVESRPSVEAAVDRWIARLERARPLTSCELSIAIESQFLGKKRVRLDLVVTCDDAEVTICNVVRLRDPSELYALIADAFRDAYHRLDDRPGRPAARQLHTMGTCGCRPSPTT